MTDSPAPLSVATEPSGPFVDTSYTMEHTVKYLRLEADRLRKEHGRNRVTATYHALADFLERGVIPFIEWAQEGDNLDSGRWAGHDVFDAVRIELQESRARVAELELERDSLLLSYNAERLRHAQTKDRLAAAVPSVQGSERE